MNYNRKDIIAALATTPGMSAISIIRISGEDLKPLFKLITRKKTLKNRYATYCDIYNPKEQIIIDKCILIYYQKPTSYTGEDVIEINCHGGKIISELILNMLYDHGVQPALSGEFSYRAFLNNKINLVEAESISSLISSSSKYSHNIIMDNFDEKISNNILNINKQITAILSIIEHELDFSEHEIEHITIQKILKELDIIAKTVKMYLKNQSLVKIIRSGINVVIMGVPNAGKSSLFNKLVGYDRTVVSSEAGTTRDSVEVKLLINQYPINLIDTAGYFDAKDKINIDSIKQTEKYSKDADIIIYLDEHNPIEKCKNLDLQSNKIIFCKSKQDNVLEQLSDNGAINISSKNNFGINQLYSELSTKISTDYKYDFNNDISLVSNRQIKIFEQADELLEKIIKLLQQDVGMDIIASYMHELTTLFDECLGKVSNNKVLESIFSTFCVGK